MVQVESSTIVKSQQYTDALKKQNKQLTEALQALYDAQNDAPLERDRAEWEEAMRMAEEALREVK